MNEDFNISFICNKTGILGLISGYNQEVFYISFTMIMNRQIILTAAIYGALAVITGAFGAHALKSKLEPAQLEVWHTAVQYQFYHVLALLFLSTLNPLNNNLLAWSYYLFSFGIVLFSGSLYLLSARQVLGWPWLRFLGPITPLGGLFFIAGWVTLGLGVLKKP